MAERVLSLPASVVEAGGLDAWNRHPNLKVLADALAAVCKARTVEESQAELRGIMSLGVEHNLWAYAYLRKMAARSPDLYYATLLSEPAILLPVAYTPVVGEACQKFGLMPLYPRGCYVSLRDRGNVKAVLEEYASHMLSKDAKGQYECQCIVFSDGGRILGLGDLGTFGMGIPVGKLDLYTVCGGFDPNKTIPVMLDVGCTGADGNSAKMVIRDGEMYTGSKQDRVKHKSGSGTDVNSCYYGEDSFIGEFMSAATTLFGTRCLLQFEDFNSNDAFPLLAEYREKYLTYNDDIQGTASVAVAAVLGGIKLQKPQQKDLLSEVRQMTFLFFGAGSANLGAASLLHHEAGVPASQVFCTNSRGVIWRSEDGSKGTFRNDEQKAVAQVGEPTYDSKDLVAIIEHTKPDALIGAVGVAPGSFTKEVVEAMVRVQEAKPDGGLRPIIFALSNPKTQAEITAADCYKFSGGKAIYGSGTRFPEEVVNGKLREPGQVNNFFIFPGLSFGAYSCGSRSIPEKFFMTAAQAVANSLDDHDFDVDSVLPNPDHIRQVAENVATAVVLEAQTSGLATITLGDDEESVTAALQKLMWKPQLELIPRPCFRRSISDFGGGYQ
jgi:malate dehydrogenase (oxaloacetate-decarboxylating)(NADP+)